MTLLGKLMSLFPVVHSTLIASTGVCFFASPSLVGLFVVVAVIYLFPLICFRIYQIYYPIKEGRADLTKKVHNSWYGAHMIQNVFIAFPLFEKILRIVPGLYSLWLRAWGSKIGKGVYWTPVLEVLDRILLEVGDGCLFGYNVKISSHHISLGSKYGMILIVKRTCIGDHALVGAETCIGPGVVVESGASVPATTNWVYNDLITRKGSKRGSSV